jgi:hypothetical protein
VSPKHCLLDIFNLHAIKPCTKHEFMNYLKYIERAPENLQFFLWFVDYEKRFNALPESEKVLAQIWTDAQADSERKEYRARMKKGTAGVDGTTANELFQGTDFDNKAMSTEPPNVDPSTINEPAGAFPAGLQPRDMSSSDVSSFRPTTGFRSVLSAQTQAESAFEEVGLNKPCKLIS